MCTINRNFFGLYYGEKESSIVSGNIGRAMQIGTQRISVSIRKARPQVPGLDRDIDCTLVNLDNLVTS